MAQRSVALAAALIVAASAAARSAPLPAAPATIVNASTAGLWTQTDWSDPPAKTAPGKLALADAAPSSKTVAPATSAANAPEVVSKTPASSPQPIANDKPVAKEEPATLSPRTGSKSAASASTSDRPASKPRNHHSARYAGGEGGSWKTGRNSYGFSGTFGGCRFTGFAGPSGYKLDRVC